MMSKIVLLKKLIFGFDVLAVLLIVLLLIIRIFGRRLLHSKKKVFNIIILFFVGFLFFQYFIYIDVKYLEPNWTKVEKLHIRDENFSKKLSQLRIVHITDLHIERIGYREKSLVKKINALKPDLILITGDFLNKGDSSLVISVLSQIKSKLGIYGVFGDIDYLVFGRDNIDEFKSALENIGVQILDNKSVRIPLGKEEALWLIGFSQKEVDRAVAHRVFQGVNLSEAKILLAHWQDIINSNFITPKNTDLVLVGDTHGAQFGLPFLRRYLSKDKYISGLYWVKGIPLYVNRGIGTNRKDLRFLCRPEITLLNLNETK